MIPNLDEGDMIKTSPSAPYSNLLLWTPTELKIWGTVELIEKKKIEILTEYSLKNKESIKKMVRDFEFGWGRYDRNKPKCSVFELALMNSNWTKVLGRPHFLSLARCEQLGNWPWWHSKMNYTLALHWTADEPTQGSKIDQAQKGAMAMPYGKNCVHVTPLR